MIVLLCFAIMHVVDTTWFWCVVDTSRWINFSLLDQFIWLIYHLFCNHTLDQCYGKYLLFMCTHILIVDTNCLLHFCPVRNQEHVAGMPSMRPCSTSLSWLGALYPSTSRRKEAMAWFLATVQVVLVWHTHQLVHRRRPHTRQAWCCRCCWRGRCHTWASLPHDRQTRGIPASA
jgi:hypothetical protein